MNAPNGERGYSKCTITQFGFSGTKGGRLRNLSTVNEQLANSRCNSVLPVFLGFISQSP
ncbi:hypothetical protein [Plectonema phage Pbo-yong3]|uniref:hypothetical protein n=1 Tax=Plectonema phage Pbo-yong3 TaxID=2970324 RepID=UPI00403CB495|nr:hypothetical protein [Plectonema phage Pbo-yong3]